MNIFKMYKVINEVKERLNRELHFNVIYNYDGDKNSFTAYNDKLAITVDIEENYLDSWSVDEMVNYIKSGIAENLEKGYFRVRSENEVNICKFLIKHKMLLNELVFKDGKLILECEHEHFGIDLDDIDLTFKCDDEEETLKIKTFNAKYNIYKDFFDEINCTVIAI